MPHIRDMREMLTLCEARRTVDPQKAAQAAYNQAILVAGDLKRVEPSFTWSQDWVKAFQAAIKQRAATGDDYRDYLSDILRDCWDPSPLMRGAIEAARDAYEEEHPGVESSEIHRLLHAEEAFAQAMALTRPINEPETMHAALLAMQRYAEALFKYGTSGSDNMTAETRETISNAIPLILAYCKLLGAHAGG